MHPNQAQPRRTMVSRATRKPAPSYQHAGRFHPYPRRRGATGRIKFPPDPARLSGVVPPAVKRTLTSPD